MTTYNETDRTFDCEPSLTDSQVLAFCRDGYLMLPGVVDDETNQRSCAWLNGELPADPSYMPEGLTIEDLERIRGTHEPSTLLLEQWYIDNVLLNAELAGALRSLLGRHVGLPVLVSKHNTNCPNPAWFWHHDNDYVFGPELNYLEVFYYPRDTPNEMGPTEIVPGSHITRTHLEPEDKGVSTAGPAGTLAIHHQSIYHRKGEATATGVRPMLKYNYWRTVAPERDWIVEPDFDFRTANYGNEVPLPPAPSVNRYVAHMFYWLCGKGDHFRTIGGQAWPCVTENQIGPSYGFDSTEGYRPDWQRKSLDSYER